MLGRVTSLVRQDPKQLTHFGKTMMGDVFEPGIINGMELPNRFIRWATWVAMATDTGFTPKLIEAMVYVFSPSGTTILRED